jgi:hypothetical protein
MSLVADCGGAIRRLALAFPPHYLDPDRDAERTVLAATISAFDAGVTVLLLTESDAAATVTEWAAQLQPAAALQVVATAPYGLLHRRGGLWAQDSFLAAAGQYLIPLTGGEVGHGALLAAADGTPLTPVEIVLEGGDSLVGPDFRLIGAEAVNRTAEFRRLTIAAAETALAAIDPRPLTVAGYFTADLGAAAASSSEKRFQPWFHLDLMVAVTGLRRDGRPLLLVADPRDGTAPDAPRHPAHAPRLDAMAARLEGAGFAVIRNPVPVLRPPQGGSRAPRAYNNVLVQNDPAIVWLPQFSDLEPALAGSDASNCEIWRDLGFAVRPVAGWSALAGPGGALRCAVKVLERASDPLRQPDRQA